MKTVIIILLVLTALTAVYIWMIAPRRRHPAALDEFVGRQYAHRGLHDSSKGIPENTLLAFQRAAEHGYGMEFDVRLTADHRLVVMHDDSLERMTGCKAKVSESTLEELSRLRIGGTDQPIPRFEQVLEVVNGRVPLIIEIKTGGKNNARLCREVCSTLEKYDGPYVIESFDPRIVRWFRVHRPDIVRGQLMEYYRRHGDTNVPVIFDSFIHDHFVNLYVRPDFVAINHADRDTLPMKLSRRLFNTPEFDWTVRTQQQADASTRDGSAFIFEGFIPTA